MGRTLNPKPLVLGAGPQRTILAARGVPFELSNRRNRQRLAAVGETEKQKHAAASKASFLWVYTGYIPLESNPPPTQYQYI